MVPIIDYSSIIPIITGQTVQDGVHDNSSSYSNPRKETSCEPSTVLTQVGSPTVDPEDNQYLVERLLERLIYHYLKRKVAKYLVQWKGYSAEYDSWLRESNIHKGLVK
ncbi:Chromo domain/shadow [Macrophomina phaseolina MS6]|uniref:Chromo domain/shadow n=1 Tax=Macrophomina phaseolina (strain MS6) TaxID=1126212 RepID=K2SIX0_MACPH|nr:Chromo domain/shadow [Macrophomina phaseolina MS6]